jgi:hypothetical protein
MPSAAQIQLFQLFTSVQQQRKSLPTFNGGSDEHQRKLRLSIDHLCAKFNKITNTTTTTGNDTTCTIGALKFSPNIQLLRNISNRMVVWTSGDNRNNIVDHRGCIFIYVSTTNGTIPFGLSLHIHIWTRKFLLTSFSTNHNHFLSIRM